MKSDFSSDLDINAWWRALDVSWKRVFKRSIDINHNPTEEEIREVLKLEAIDIAGESNIISLEPLQYFRGLRKLNLSETKIQTLNKIKNLTLIDELDCSSSEVNSLAPIEGFKNLWRINCSNTKIHTLAGVENLADLEYLDCSGTTVADLSPLYGLNKLKMVNCDFTSVSDVSILQSRNVSLSYTETPARMLEEKRELLEDRDALLVEAAKLVVMHQQASTSLIQRKLKLGYARAGRIIERLEAAGIVGSLDGTGARKVNIENEEDLMMTLDPSYIVEEKNDAAEGLFVQPESEKERPPINHPKHAFTSVDKRNVKILVGGIVALLMFIFVGRLTRAKTEAESEPINAIEIPRNSQESTVYKPIPSEGKVRRLVTIDGYDPASKEVIDPINLWANYQTRTIAGKLRHREQVYLIRRDGDGVFIETGSGVKGWVTYFFIDEFN